MLFKARDFHQPRRRFRIHPEYLNIHAGIWFKAIILDKCLKVLLFVFQYVFANVFILGIERIPHKIRITKTIKTSTGLSCRSLPIACIQDSPSPGGRPFAEYDFGGHDALSQQCQRNAPWVLQLSAMRGGTQPTLHCGVKSSSDKLWSSSTSNIFQVGGGLRAIVQQQYAILCIYRTNPLGRRTRL